MGGSSFGDWMSRRQLPSNPAGPGPLSEEPADAVNAGSQEGTGEGQHEFPQAAISAPATSPRGLGLSARLLRRRLNVESSTEIQPAEDEDGGVGAAETVDAGSDLSSLPELEAGPNDGAAVRHDEALSRSPSSDSFVSAQESFDADPADRSSATHAAPSPEAADGRRPRSRLQEFLGISSSSVNVGVASVSGKGASHGTFRLLGSAVGKRQQFSFLLGRDRKSDYDASPSREQPEIPQHSRRSAPGVPATSANVSPAAASLTGRPQKGQWRQLFGYVSSGQKLQVRDETDLPDLVLGPMADSAKFHNEVTRQFKPVRADPATTAAVDAFSNELTSLLKNDAPGKVPFERPLAVAEALALATGGDIAQAREALEHLTRGIDPNEAASGPALKAAQILAKSPGGFEALEALNRSDPPEKYDGRTVTPRIRKSQALRAFLEAGGALEDAGSGKRKKVSRDMAETVMAAARSVHASPEQPAGDVLREAGGLSEYFAWRQGFRDKSKGSELDKVQHRLHKSVTVWLRRAVAVGDEVPGKWGKFRRGKSPFRAMKMGLQGAHLQPSDKVSRNFGSPEQAGELEEAQKPLAPETMDHAGVRAVLMQLNDVIPGGNAARLSDGHAVGLTSYLGFSAGGAVLAPVLGASSNKQALVELAGTLYGGELFVGVERNVTARAGLQVRTPGQQAGFIGGAAGLVFNSESKPRKGVRIRTIKRLEDGVGSGVTRPDGDGMKDAWRLNMREVLQTILDTDPEEKSTPDSRDRLFERLASKFADSEDLSLTWQEDRTSNVSANLSGAAGFGGIVNGVGLRAGVGMGYTANRTATLQNDRTGSFRRTVSSVGTTGRGTAQIGLNVVPPSAGAVHLQGTPEIGTSSTFGEAGAMESLKIARDGGHIREIDTFKDREFRSAAAHRSEILKNKDAWTRVFGSQQALESALKQMDEDVRPGQTYIERWSIRPEVARQIDAAQTRIALLEAAAESANDLERPSFEKKIMQIENVVARSLALPENWDPFMVATLESASVAKRAGVDYGVELTANTASASDRLLSWTLTFGRERAEAHERRLAAIPEEDAQGDR